MPSKGQFLETGYGTASNEKAFDLAISDNGLVMAGYVDSSETGRFLSIWQTDSLGHVLWHYKQEDVTQSYARSIAYKPTTSMLLSAGAIAPNFSWNEVLRDEDQLFVAAVSSSGDFGWSYTHTTNDTSTAAVDVLPTPTGYAVLANFLPDNSTYSQPYIVFLTDSGTLQGLLPLGRNDKTLLAFKMQLNPTDSSLVVAANEYLTSGKVIPTLYTINKTGTTYKSFSYTADDHCEIHSLAQDPTGNWWLAGESYSSGDTLATVIKTNYAYAKQATYSYSYSHYNSFNDIIVDSTQLICIGTTDIYLNPDSINSQGEGGYDVLLHYISFSGDSLLMQTLGGESLDEGHSIIKVPNEDIAFGVGYNKSYGVEESGNAYKMGFLLKDITPAYCRVPRVLYVDNLISDRDLNTNIIFDVLGNSTLEDQLIFWAKDNNITYFAIYKLGFLFDEQSNQSDEDYGRAALLQFIAKCTKQGIRCGYIADNSFLAYSNVSNWNINTLNYKWFDDQKFRFNILEHEFWNASVFNQDPAYNFTLRNTQDIVAYNTSNQQNSTLDNQNAFFSLAYDEHKTCLNELVIWKNLSANIWNTFDYVTYFFNAAPSTSEGATNNPTARKAKTVEINQIANAVFTPYYMDYSEIDQNNSQTFGIHFLDPWDPTIDELGNYRRRLEDFGDNNTDGNMVPIFSGELYTGNTTVDCGQNQYTNFLGQYLDGPPFTNGYANGHHFNNVESIFQVQYNDILAHPDVDIDFPFINYNKIPAFAWFKSSCLWEKTDFSDKSLVLCEGFNDMTLPRELGMVEALKNESLKIFPNPTTGSITIEGNNTIQTVEIISLTGVEVYKANAINSKQIQLTLNLPAGFYIVKLVDVFGQSSTAKISLL